jgi:hypothetical protein
MKDHERMLYANTRGNKIILKYFIYYTTPRAEIKLYYNTLIE